MLARAHHSGFSMIEVLVTAVIVSFGLLGIAGFQAKASVGETESYQRAQALGLLSDITERIRANPAQASSYVVNGTVGTGDSQPSSCTSLALGAARDMCEWSNALKGTSEKKGTANSGGLTGGLGCITTIQAANPAAGTCTPAIYQVSIAWLGAHPTLSPQLNCGRGAFGTDDGFRRALVSQVVIGLPSCS